MSLPEFKFVRQLAALVLMGVLAPAGLVADALQTALSQGGLAVGRVPPGATVSLDGGAAAATEDGTLLVAVGRDFPGQAELQITLADGTRYSESVPVQDREFKIQRIDGLPAKQVTPPKEVLARIRREQAKVGKARATNRHQADFSGGFVWPLEGPITGVYGSQRILNGEPRQPHYGVDVAAPVGTVVTAPAAGLVTLAEPDLYFSGGTLIIDHGYRLSSSFLHLSEITVPLGARVKQGDPIALVGATGRVTGPHLDWRMNLGPVRIDPVLVLEALPTSRSAGGGQ